MGWFGADTMKTDLLRAPARHLRTEAILERPLQVLSRVSLQTWKRLLLLFREGSC